MDDQKVLKTNLKNKLVKQKLSNVGVSLDTVCCRHAFDALQLNSFEGEKVCEHYKEMAKVMVTDNNMTVACLNVRIEQ